MCILNHFNQEACKPTIRKKIEQDGNYVWEEKFVKLIVHDNLDNVSNRKGIARKILIN